MDREDFDASRAAVEPRIPLGVSSQDRRSQPLPLLGIYLQPDVAEEVTLQEKVAKTRGEKEAWVDLAT